MKKSLILVIISMVVLLLIVIVFCKIFGVEMNVINGGRNVKFVLKDFNYIDLFNGGDNLVDNLIVDNLNVEDENVILISFIFNGKKYKISREDIFDIKDVIYVLIVLNDNVKEFKVMLFIFEDYKKVEYLDSENFDFFLIVKIFYYVRNLEYFKKGFFYRVNEKILIKINVEEYKKLIDIVIKIMEDFKLSIMLNRLDLLNVKELLDFKRVKDLIFKKVYELVKSSGVVGIFWGKLKIWNVNLEFDGSFEIEIYFEEILFKNDYFELEINVFGNIFKKMFFMYWIFNRMVDNFDFYNFGIKVNELFLISEFFFKKDLDFNKYIFNIDILMFNYWLRVKWFVM